MADDKSHIDHANLDQKTVDYLLQTKNDFSAWIATIAFYKALHIVEAVFARNPRILHTHDHFTRESHLKLNRRYDKIYKHYSALKRASLIARYLEDSDPKSIYKKFSDFMPKEKVISELLNYRLFELERSAGKILKPKPRTKKRKKQKKQPSGGS